MPHGMTIRAVPLAGDPEQRSESLRKLSRHVVEGDERAWKQFFSESCDVDDSVAKAVVFCASVVR
jgi:hypothetical protein